MATNDSPAGDVEQPAAQTSNDADRDATTSRSARGRRIDWARLLVNNGAVFVLVLFIIFFTIARPHTFPTLETFKIIVVTQSVLALVALGLIAPLVTAEFDLSIGATLGLGAILSTKFVSIGLPVPVAILTAIAAGGLVGAVNSILVVVLEVSSFIATLGTSIIIAGITLWVSGGFTIFQNIGPSFTNLASKDVGGVLPLPGLYLVVVAVLLWYFLERTPLGREMYVTGYGREAARLAGIRVQRRIVLGLVLSATIGSMAGVINAANIGSAGPVDGAAFLLPGFAAAFLGSTTIKTGRFNVVGTLVASALLAVGITGLLLMGAQPYIRNFFYGAALIVSVAVAQVGARRLRNRRGAAR